MELEEERKIAGDKLHECKHDVHDFKDLFEKQVESTSNSNQYLYIDIWEPYGFA
jgi:hypothetical protein